MRWKGGGRSLDSVNIIPWYRHPEGFTKAATRGRILAFDFICHISLYLEQPKSNTSGFWIYMILDSICSIIILDLGYFWRLFV